MIGWRQPSFSVSGVAMVSFFMAFASMFSMRVSNCGLGPDIASRYGGGRNRAAKRRRHLQPH
jgi:hypothetical protein